MRNKSPLNMNYGPILIGTLTVTQDGFRYPPESATLDEIAKPIVLSVLEDGEMFIASGHHHIAKIYLSGRRWIRPEEYRLDNQTYKDWNSINFKCDFVTPLDLRTEVRVSDCVDFKAEAVRLSKESTVRATAFIAENTISYKRPRTVWSIMELLNVKNYQGAERFRQNNSGLAII